eukprot:COSAG01_NODE_1465_length_10223_cov_4.478961_10_plen_483_part_01
MQQAEGLWPARPSKQLDHERGFEGTGTRTRTSVIVGTSIRSRKNTSRRNDEGGFEYCDECNEKETPTTPPALPAALRVGDCMPARSAAVTALALVLAPALTWSAPPATGWRCRSEIESFANCSVAEVIQHMRARPQHAPTQSQGAYALGLHALDAEWIVDTGRRADVIEAGGLSEVLAAMSRMPAEAGVQGHGAYALGFLARGDVRGAGEACGLAIARAMATFPLDSEVQASGLFTLAELLSSEEADEALRSSVGVELRSFELAHRAMLALPADLGVQANGCLLLAVLASLEPASLAAAAASSKMWAMRGRAAVTAAMAAFPEQEMTHHFGQAVLDATDASTAAGLTSSRKGTPPPRPTTAQVAPPPEAAAAAAAAPAAPPTAKRPLPSPPPQHQPAAAVATEEEGEEVAAAAVVAEAPLPSEHQAQPKPLSTATVATAASPLPMELPVAPPMSQRPLPPPLPQPQSAVTVATKEKEEAMPAT